MNRMLSDGTWFNNGIVLFIAENAIPVENAAKSPQTIPNPGINIGSAIEALWTNIPIASIPFVMVSNSSIIIVVSSSDS
jgi:hypothetical protein